MNKKLLLFGLPVLALSLCCCGDDDNEPEIKDPIIDTEEPSVPGNDSIPETTDSIPGTDSIPEIKPEPKWTLVWEDDFDSTDVDYTVWSRIPEDTPDWAKCQSLDDRCYEKRESSIVLKGINNDDKTSDPRDYLCGGLWTLEKKAFGPGRIEVCARMTSGTGAWPAIWMMPFKSEQGWPYDGEIDIMEHLNYDRSVYQTLHSKYIDVDGFRNNPQYSSLTSVTKIDQYHVYGVDITADSIRFHIDGVETLSYPNTGAPDQYPYYKEWDLRIDMQLGGSWVGAVRPSALPVEMEVDWVRYYQYK